MNTASVLFHCLPYFIMTAYGIYAVLEVYFPALRDADFNRWQVDDDSGSYITVMGWRNVLKPPRVIAQGYMSEGTACAVAMSFGVLFIIVGIMGIRHVSGIPEALPDFLVRLSGSD